MFRLSDRGPPPNCPHTVCLAEDPAESGYAWHAEHPACFGHVLEIPLPAKIVGIALDGRMEAVEPGQLPATASAIDEILCLVKIKQEAQFSFERLFVRTCLICQKNHWQRAYCAVAAARFIHPDAVCALREARVPKRFLIQQWIRNGYASDPTPEPSDKKTKTRLAAKERNLPVWVRDEARTLQAQLAFASRWRVKQAQLRLNG